MNSDSPTSPDFSTRVHLLLRPATHGVRVASLYGTTEQLKDIANRLQAELEVASTNASVIYGPKRLFSIDATGLSGANAPAAIEFYLASIKTPKPKPWGGPLFGSVWALIFAVIGAIATCKWVISLFY